MFNQPPTKRMNTLQNPSEFLLAILEGFLDGILVLTTQKHLLYCNNPAQRLCQRLLDKNATGAIPSEIWQVCEALLDSHQACPEKLVIMESEVKCEDVTLRVRVQWLAIEGLDPPCLLVRVQDQQQAIQTLAIAEAQNWNLTERERQVWMLRRSGLRRKQIANQLYISEDTVKKHLGNVKAKRQSHLDEAEWQQHHAHSTRTRHSA